MKISTLGRDVTIHPIVQELTISLPKANFNKNLDVSVWQELKEDDLLGRTDVWHSFLQHDELGSFLKQMLSGDGN